MSSQEFTRASLERLTKEELILIVLGMQADRQSQGGKR